MSGYLYDPYTHTSETSHCGRLPAAGAFEDAIHGAEIINGNPRHGNCGEKALELCRPGVYRLAGSDPHQAGDGTAGALLPRRVHDSYEYKNMTGTKQFRLWCPEKPDFFSASEAMWRRTADGPV